MTAQRRRLLLAVGSAAVLLVAGLAWFSVSRVPEGRLGVISAASDADSDIEIAAPGFHFHAPVRRVTLLRAGAVAHHGAARLVTPEGAQQEIAWRAQLDLSRATPDRLASLARRMAGGSSEIDAVRAEIEGAIVRAARAGFPAPEAVARELEASGLMPGTLSLGASGVPSPAAARPNPLLDSYSGPAWPILVIGVDSADWDLMLPLMEAGELPHLRALKERGAWATLRSMSPTLSPILWTTMATGRPPEEHGILDFLQVDPATGAEAPISRAFRRVKALWNIAGDMRIPSATVGWWATWPAEKVTGAMVTDRVAYSLFDLPLHGGQAGAAYPDALLDDINRLRVPEDSVTYDQFRPILPVSPDRFEEARLALGTPDGFRDPVSHMIKVLASTRTYHRIGVELIRRDRPGLALVYFEGLDEVNHRFAHFTAPPMRLSASADAELREAGSRAVAGFYRFQDRLVGELVEAAGPEAVVMVLSDHGFANGSERPLDTPPDIDGKPGLWHTLDGVLIVAGPPIRPGPIDGTATLLDVTPTLLAILGLPTAQDMPGRALSEIFRSGAAPVTPAVLVSSYDEIGAPLERPGAPGSSEMDSEMLAKLTALGYIEAGPGQAEGALTATYHVNAGHLYLRKNDLERSRQEFARARALAPRFDQPLLGLAQVEIQRGDPGAALPFIEEALKSSDSPEPVLLLRAARLYRSAGVPERGLEFLSSLGFQGRREAYRLAAIGSLYEESLRSREALDAYVASVRADPSVERALQGAYAILKREGRLDELAALLERGLSAESERVAVRAANWLALTREQQGRRDEARKILLDALGRSPDDLMTLTNLGAMLVREDRSREALPYLGRAYSVEPASLEVLVNLIVAHAKVGRLAEARRFLGEGERLAAGAQLRPLLNAFAYACFLAGELEEAGRYVDRSLAMDPSQRDVLLLREEIGRKKAPPGL